LSGTTKSVQPQQPLPAAVLLLLLGLLTNQFHFLFS